MNYMTCTTCRGLVTLNATGICLRCQMGFTQAPQGDEIAHDPTAEPVKVERPSPKKRRQGPKKRKPTKKAT